MKEIEIVGGEVSERKVSRGRLEAVKVWGEGAAQGTATREKRSRRRSIRFDNKCVYRQRAFALLRLGRHPQCELVICVRPASSPSRRDRPSVPPAHPSTHPPSTIHPYIHPSIPVTLLWLPGNVHQFFALLSPPGHIVPVKKD